MAMNTMEFFKVTLMIMLFYSAAINIITYSLPEDTLNYVVGFSDLGGAISLQEVSEDIQTSVERQTSIPVIELGALLFYSGNIIIDLLLNFAFAIPEMIALIITGIMMLLNLDPYFVNIFQLFLMVIVTVMYFIGIIQLLTSIRSGRLV